MVMHIELHIERLVLDGVALSSRDRAALTRAVSSELSRLLTNGLHPDVLSGGAHAAVTGGSIAFDTAAGGGRLGEQIARAVHGGIGITPQPQGTRGRAADAAAGSGRGGPLR
jgi:hypothetical protein